VILTVKRLFKLMLDPKRVLHRVYLIPSRELKVRHERELMKAIRIAASVDLHSIQDTMHTSASGQVSGGARQRVEVSEARDARHKIMSQSCSVTIRQDKALPLHFVSESGIHNAHILHAG
jgi:ABC-type dipeptide/oligopeptide/nickel transport system ATPase subunit